MMQLVTILCPLDFSAASAPLLAYATALASCTGAELRLLHVLEPQLVLSGETAALPEPEAQQLLLQYQAQAAQAGAQRVATLVRHGEAAREIVREAAEHHADLIVIGSHGQTGLTRFLMGNTAEHVVRCAPCAAILVKPQSDSAFRQSA
ncbi:universal stress protein [Hymenobacter busanensis]|uniref:Universal stress protein n=1 Tax=Hymenobacter busanensis TaxID=2607656 RepID=A0A7L5A044_9BACT|nr:universal stress protein [Hymenobacter busanensis]KAA9331399.1 universal stress protein [Hymenobacter busanensis]QHJ08553.1 universal stress protein [Hymenobacter busanensis]